MWACSVFSALDLVVALMELDEVCELVTDPKYAYGEAGKYDFCNMVKFLVSFVYQQYTNYSIYLAIFSHWKAPHNLLSFTFP